MDCVAGTWDIGDGQVHRDKDSISAGFETMLRTSGSTMAEHHFDQSNPFLELCEYLHLTEFGSLMPYPDDCSGEVAAMKDEDVAGI
jgi:hypothetical protein